MMVVKRPFSGSKFAVFHKSLIPYANAATRVSVTLDGRQLDEGSKVLEDEGKKVILKFKVDVTGLSGDLFYLAFKLAPIQGQFVRLFNASLLDAMFASPFSA